MNGALNFTAKPFSSRGLGRCFGAAVFSPSIATPFFGLREQGGVIMKDPKPIHTASDDYFRKLGWPVVARDADGHAMTLCAFADDQEWLAECREKGWSVTDLRVKGEGA